MTYLRLDINMILNVYRRLLSDKGYSSCGLVAEELDRMGIVTRTGRAPTRQALHYLMIKTQEGRDLLMITKRRIGRADL